MKIVVVNKECMNTVAVLVAKLNMGRIETNTSYRA